MEKDAHLKLEEDYSHAGLHVDTWATLRDLGLLNNTLLSPIKGQHVPGTEMCLGVGEISAVFTVIRNRICINRNHIVVLLRFESEKSNLSGEEFVKWFKGTFHPER